MTDAGRTTTRTLLLVVVAAAVLVALAAPAMAGSGRWVSGDIHNHSYLTDGKKPMGEVFRNAFSVYGLDYMANSEHGGQSTYNNLGTKFVTPVWRWITLANYAYPLVGDARENFPERRAWLGVEWNAPTHEHVSVGVVGAANEPSGVSNFEYRFDAADNDTSRANEGTQAVVDPVTGEVYQPATAFSKVNKTAADALAAVQWLQDTYGDSAYALINHVSRKNLWQVGDLRAMNDIAPDVCFGMEGFPGHQASPARGEYGNYIKADGTVTTDPAQADPTLTSHARTYGGADWMTATLGGVWDSLLGEGRHWWVIDNSDYHTTSTSYADKTGTTIGLDYADFWPGQYGKTWTHVKKFTDQGIVDGMRSGNMFIVNGDLINQLKFTVASGKKSATMGGTLGASGKVTVKIAVKSPKENNNGDAVKLDHIDLIAGSVTGPIPADAPGYTTTTTNPTTHIVKTFNKSGWKIRNGWKVMTYKVPVTGGTYFRLRGSNIAPNTPNVTDEAGNPLMDELAYVDYPNPKDGGATTAHGNTPDLAWSSLWFYSNPIFVYAK